MATIRHIAQRGFPYFAVVPFILTAVLPDTLNPAVVTLCGLLLGGLLCIVGATGRLRPTSRGSAVAVGLMVATAAWFVLVSAWAVNPRVSLFGVVGLHTGAALWVLAAVWVSAGLLCANARALRETLFAIALVGPFFVAAQVYEILKYGLGRPGGALGYAAGFFENSNSAGEMLAAAMLASAIYLLLYRGRATRIAVAVAGVISGVGLYLSLSRTGLLGILAAIAFAGLIVLLPAKNPRSWVPASVAVVLATGVTAVLTLASTGLLGAGALRLTSIALSGREAIWRSAWSQLERNALLGSGLEHFSALVSWSVADGALTSVGTADPHNILLAAALGGGIIGLVLVVLSFCALLTEGTTIARAANRKFGVALLAAVPAAVLGWGLVSWVAPAPMLAAGAMTGAMLGAARSQPAPAGESADGRSRAATVAGVLVGVGALVLVLVGVQLIPIEHKYVTGLMPGRQPLSPASAALLYLRSHDPGIAQYALEALAPEVQQGNAAALAQSERILAMSERDASWSATLALRGLVVAQAVSVFGGGDAQIDRLVKAGISADPAAGAWYAFAALDAERRRMPAAAQAFARRALDYPMDAESRSEMKRLANP